MQKQRSLWIFRIILLALLLLVGVRLALVRSAEKPDPNAQDGTTLSLWTVNWEYADFMRQRMAAYNEQAGKQRINLDVKVYSRSFIVDQVTKSLFHDEQLPDMVDIRYGDMDKFVRIDEHPALLYPLNSIVKQSSADAALFSPFSFNDTLLAIPYSTGDLAIFYNLELLERYHIAPETIKTWDAFFDMGRRFHEESELALMPLEIENQDIVYALLLTRADAPIDNELCRIDDPALLDQTIRELRALIMEDVLRIPEGFDIYNQKFFETLCAGEYLCVVAPLEYVQEFIRNMPELKGRVLIQPLPFVGKNGARPLVAQYGTAITIKSRNIALAKDFLSFAKLNAEAYRCSTDALFVRNIAADAEIAQGSPQSESYGAYFPQNASLTPPERGSVLKCDTELQDAIDAQLRKLLLALQ